MPGPPAEFLDWLLPRNWRLFVQGTPGYCLAKGGNSCGPVSPRAQQLEPTALPGRIV